MDPIKQAANKALKDKINEAVQQSIREKVRLVERMFNGYCKGLYPNGFGFPEQQSQVEMAFYGGCYAMFSMIEEVSGVATEEDALTVCKMMHEELSAFNDRMKAEGAKASNPNKLN